MPEDPFKGNGFAREEFSEEERAQMREALNKLRAAWPFVQAGAEIRSGAIRIAGIVAVGGGVGAAVAVAIKMGLFS